MNWKNLLIKWMWYSPPYVIQQVSQIQNKFLAVMALHLGITHLYLVHKQFFYLFFSFCVVNKEA